jgi:hypothetical protein
LSLLPPESADAAPPVLGSQRRQLALQLAAALAVLSLAWPYYGLRNEQLPWPETALAIGAVALLFASLTRQPWWWRLMHALFVPLAWSASTIGIDPGWYLLLFMVLLLVYRGAVTGQVPLYLSNTATAAAIAELTKDLPKMHFSSRPWRRRRQRSGAARPATTRCTLQRR